MKFLATIFFSLVLLTAKSQITTNFFGEAFLGPFEASFKWPSTNPASIRPWLLFGCNPRVCNSSTGYNETAIGDHILWRDINYADGTYDWYLLDRLLDSLHARNSQLLYTFGRTPQWASSQPTLSAYYAYKPTDTAKLGAFVRAIAYRAIAKGWPIKTWEIWNEPETGSTEWKDTWANLVLVGRCIYTNLKGIDPTYTVLTPATQGSGADYWMGQYFAAGGAAYCDVVAYHAYINFYNHGSGEKFETLITKMRSLMATYGISSKELWDDEGFDNFYCPSGTLCAAPDVQAAYMAQRYLISAAKGLNRVYWYSWDQNNGIEWQYVSGTYVLNNAGKAHETIRNWLIGATVTNLTITTDSIYSVDITKAGVTRRAVWSKSALPKTYATSFTQAQTLAGVTSSVGGTISLESRPVLLQGIQNKAYYISNSGNNTWAGTQAAPFQTFAKAIAVAVPGDSILYKAGETFTTNGNYITPGKDNIFIGRYSTGANPVMDGGVTIAPASMTDGGSGWKTYTNTNFGSFLNVVSIDGVPQQKARFPSSGWRTINKHSGSSYIIDSTLSEWGKNFVGWEMVIRLINWSNQRVTVWKQNGDTLFIQQSPGQKVLTYNILDGWGYFLQNGRTDTPSFGDWYYNSSTKQLNIYAGSENMANHVTRAALWANGFNVSATHITFKDLRFTHFNQWGLIKGSTADYGSALNSQFDNIGEAAIYLVDQNYWTITGSDFNYNLSDAIKMLRSDTTKGNNHTVIGNNSFNNTGLYPGMGYGGDPMFIPIVVEGDSLHIYNNTIDSAGYNGIHTSTRGSVIEYNYIQNYGQLLADCGGIYNYWGPYHPGNPAKSIGRYNTILNGGTDISGTYGTRYPLAPFDVSDDNGKRAGYYLDENSRNWELYGNNIANTPWAAFMLNGTHDIYIHDNTAFKFWRAYEATDYSSLQLPANNIRIVHNIFSTDDFSNAFTPAPQNLLGLACNFAGRTASGWLVADSNSYYTFASPTGNLFAEQTLSGHNLKTFTQWKTYLGTEANSTITQKTSHNFFYNPTVEAIGQSWNGWNDAAGTPLSGLLQPYSSVIGFNQTVTFTPQTITFSALAAKTYGDPTFTLTATASSGLPVTYVSSNTSVATVSGSTVTIVGAGTTNITASQSGNGTYSAAPDVVRTLTVLKANQSITFPLIIPKNTTDIPFTISATATSGLAVTFSIVSGPASVSGNTVTLSGVAGNVVVAANQSGNGNYNAATQVTQTITVSKVNQTISFPAIASHITTDAPFSISATASSGLTVTFSVVSGPASSSGSTITLSGAAGTVVVSANQAGNGTYNAATQVTQSFSVAKANQTITFAGISDKLDSDAPFTISATATSGLSVSFSIVSGPATISGNTITLTGSTGTVVVQASQAGNSTYNTATPVQQSFVVASTTPTTINQAIDFPVIPDHIVTDAPFTLSATASSGLTVTYSVVSGPATVSGSTLTITGTGTVTVQATQAGNATYNPATPVQQSFTVTKANQTIAFTDIPDKVVTTAPFTVSATATSSLTVTYSIISGPATVSGNTVTITGTGDVVIQADQSGNSSYSAAPSVQQTFTVSKASQTITFPAISNKILSDVPFTISATASSGLTVTFTVTSGPATISGNTLTMTGTGTVVIQADQAGDGTYNTAAPVSNTFAVTAQVVPSGKKLSYNGKLLTKGGKVLISQ